MVSGLEKIDFETDYRENKYAVIIALCMRKDTSVRLKAK
jgi:hypothetical protein